MQLVVFTIIFFIVIGGIGMYFGNRKVDEAIARQRWLKYYVYILLTSFIVLSIWFRFFLITALVIVSAGYYELVRINAPNKKSLFALCVYSLVVAGFIFYAIRFRREFQFFTYLQILAFDAFSQVVGQLIGKTLIAPKISPSKTLEGFLGGLFFAIISSVLTSGLLSISLITACFVGLFTALTGFAGDLLASLYKRAAGIKDYSNLLPGQGGILDRFDGFMMCTFCYSIVDLIFPNMLPV